MEKLKGSQTIKRIKGVQVEVTPKISCLSQNIDIQARLEYNPAAWINES